MANNRPSYNTSNKYPQMSRVPRQEGPQRPPQYGGRGGYNNGWQGGRGGGQVDSMTADMAKHTISPQQQSPAAPERKGLMIMDPSSGEEVKVENKHDGKMKRASNGKGNGKGNGKKPGPSRQSTIGGRAVTTIGGKTMSMSYAMYDPTSNDYEESPKSSSKGSPQDQSPMESKPGTPQVPLSAMPTPYTEPPVGLAGPTPYTEPPIMSAAGPSMPEGAPPATQPLGFGGLGGFRMGGSESLPGAGMPATQPATPQPPAPQQQQQSPGFMAQAGGMPNPYMQQAPPHHNPHQGDYGFAVPHGQIPYGAPPAHAGAPSMGIHPQMPSQHMTYDQHMSQQQNGMHQPRGPMPGHYGGSMQVQPQMYPSGGAHPYAQQQPRHPQQGAQPQYGAPPNVGYAGPQQSPHKLPDQANGGAPSAPGVYKPEPEAQEELEPAKMSKTQLKNQKKHQRARERKAKELREQAEETVLAWRTSVLAAPLASMGFPRERCYAAVCACSDGKTAVDLERCVAWLLSDQLFKGKQADLDISSDIQKMDECEQSGYCRADVERAVLDHGGDVDSAVRALRNGTFTSVGA